VKRNYFWLIRTGLAILMLACGFSPVLKQATPEPARPPAAGPTQTALLPTITPPPSEEPSATPAPTQAATRVGDACYSPYYPIRSDTTWLYRTQASGAATSDYSMTYKDITPSSFTAVQTFSEFSSEVRWMCTEQGLISSEYAQLNLANLPGFEFETLDVTGATLPPAERWEVGTAWDSKYQLKATADIQGVSVESQFEITMQNRIAAQEPVGVPAGSYPDALRVDSTARMVIDAAGRSTEVNLSFSNWYVQDAGLVKSASADPSAAFVLELLSVE
jgi:hypothetical protein